MIILPYKLKINLNSELENKYFQFKNFHQVIHFSKKYID